jgi:bacillolysin
LSAAQSRLVDRLSASTEGSARVSRHARTGEVRFVGTVPGSPVPRPSGLVGDASPERSARAFLDGYGALFGVRDQATQLDVLTRRGGAHGSTAVRFQQTHRGLPVIGGELVVTVDAAGNTLSANGETSSGLTVGTTPRVRAAAAAEAAKQAAAKAHHVPAAQLRTASPQLSVYDPALLDAPGPRLQSLVWRTEVRSADGDVRELVLVDAVTGAVPLHFDRNPEAKQRSVCDFGNLAKPTDACVPPFSRVEGGSATGIRDVDLAYDYAGITYDFFKDMFGRDSLDGRGLPLKSTVRFCPDDSDCPFPNAYWNGKQMVYGDSYASADDVVAHELTHGVTEFTSNLFYYYQSGAINESFSDVFGELIDLTDGRGNDTAGVRWQMGEDLPIGAIRDMMHPERFQNPDRITSPFYVTDASDAGGVHTNSGVSNKAAALLVDGGKFNGQTVTALGTDKVARIYYEAGSRLMTSATDYNDLYDVLQQACANLVGTHGITAGDCISVKSAVTATEMNLQPAGAAVPEAPICAAGQVRTDIFTDDLERPAAGNWVKARKSGFGWAYPQSDSDPAYGGFNPVYATSGVTEMWGDDPDTASDATIAKKTPFVVPAGRKTYLRFAHAYGFEAIGSTAYDGGRVEYTTNNGSTWLDAGRLAVNGGYTSTSVGALGGPGFGGVSGGYTSSRFDLSSLAGKSVRFRFRVASDFSTGNYGWFIDDIAVYSCARPQQVIRVGDAVVKEGVAGKTATATFEVTRSSGTGTATVKYATAGGTASSGTDFTAKALSTLSFAAGQTSKTVTIPVRGDSVPEAHETFSVRLSAPVGATIADASGTGTITDDDAGTPARLSVSDPVVVEGTTGTTNAVFTVTRTGTTVEPVTVTYATAAGTADTADFRALPATVLTLPAGKASARVTVPVLGDAVDEPNETFSLVLSRPARATISDASGTATVLDDEGALTGRPTTFYGVSDLRVTEGAAGANTTATMTVTRTGATTGSGSVVVATRGGTATSGVDFTPVPPTTVTFAPGETSRTVVVRVAGDAVPEPHETLQLRASSPVGGTIADDIGVLTLGDTDPGVPARLTVDDVTVREGNSGARSATFTVTRTGSTLEPVTVSWATAAAAAPYLPAATAGRDYTARPATAVAFAAGETSKRVTVPVLADSTFEPNEHFLVTLSGAGRAAVADGTGVGTVLDDD